MTTIRIAVALIKLDVDIDKEMLCRDEDTCRSR